MHISLFHTFGTAQSALLPCTRQEHYPLDEDKYIITKGKVSMQYTLFTNVGRGVLRLDLTLHFLDHSFSYSVEVIVPVLGQHDFL